MDWGLVNVLCWNRKYLAEQGPGLSFNQLLIARLKIYNRDASDYPCQCYLPLRGELWQIPKHSIERTM